MKNAAARLGGSVKQKTCSWCKTKFTPKNTIGKFCSPKCYSLAKPRKISTTKKLIFKPKLKPTTCIVCKTTFMQLTGIQKQKTCSAACRSKLIVRTTCKACGKIFVCKGPTKTSSRCTPCTTQSQRAKALAAPPKKAKRSKTTSKHIQACIDYKKAYLEKHGYIACEVCTVTNAFKFEVHHIYYASKFPRHPNLHNARNLILICSDCHKRFHGGELNLVFTQLEANRGLKELFSKNQLQ